MRSPGVLVAALAVLAASCRSNPPPSTTDAGFDAPPVDRAPDSTADAGLDQAPDLAADVPADAGRDEAPDVTPEAAGDAEPNPFAGYQWTALAVPLGAPIAALAFDDQGALYAGAGGDNLFTASPQAGIFKSADDGASWDPDGLGLGDFDVVALAAIGPAIYAGTASLMRSTDHGASWEPAGPTSFQRFQNISGQGDVVAAGDGSQLYVSTDTGRTFHSVATPRGGVVSLEVLGGGSVILIAGSSGVFRSTDMGVTFNAVQGIANGSNLFAQLRCDGVRTCYAQAYVTPNASDLTAMLKSTDAGATWTVLSQTGEDIRALAISDTGSVYFAATFTLFWRSDDGGSTLHPIPEPAAAIPVVYDCGGPYVARGDKVFAGCRDGVYRSDDKGEHWQLANGSAAAGALTGAATRIFVDNSPTALGLGGDVYVNGPEGFDATGNILNVLKRSSDGGTTWQTVASPFGASRCIVTPSGALECAGTSTASSPSIPLARSEDHGATWRSVDVPALFLPSTPGLALASSGSVVYLADGAGLARSTDDGLTFQLLPNSPFVGSMQVLRNGHLLVTELDGSAADRSTDQGATWQPIDDLRGLPVIEDAIGRLLRSTTGTVEVSTDEAATWTTVSMSGVPTSPSTGQLLPLAIDGAGHLFVLGRAPSFNDPIRIFASADDGVSFLPMPAQIPNPNVLSFATDKQGRLLVGTAGGLFRLESPVAHGSP